MPSVASQAVHALQHGHAPHGRAGTPHAKEPETPFAQLLEQLGAPAPDSDDPAHETEPTTEPRSTAPGEHAQADNKVARTQSDGKRSETPQSDAGDATRLDDAAAAAQVAAGAADQVAADATDDDNEADKIEGKTDLKTDDNGDKEVSPSPATMGTAEDTVPDEARQPRGLEIAATVAAVVPPVGQQDRSAPTLPETASAVAVLATGKIAARDPGKVAGSTAMDEQAPMPTGAPGAEAEAQARSAVIDASPPSPALSSDEAFATDPSPDKKSAVEAKQSQTQAEQNQAPGAVDDKEAPEPEAGGIAAPASAAPGRKPGEARASSEQAADKPDRARLAGTSQAGDTARAPGDIAVTGSNPSGAVNATPAEVVRPAAVPNGEGLADAPGRTAAPSANAPAVAVPIVGVAVEIAARAQAGNHRFEIRLDPPELGRVEVRLDMDKNGHVNSHLIVDRPDTLDLLRRDASDLQRALQQAGLTTTDDGLQFSLRDQSFAGFGNGNGDHANLARLVVSNSELNPAETVAAGYGRMPPSGGGVDIRV